jgi:DNA-binding transcriptional LysR family regulator
MIRVDRLESMRIFAAVADAKSFARAAQALGLSAPAVSRAVVALERRLGAQLLRRTTRSVGLTDAGARFHADCTRILANVAVAEADATGAHTRPQGELSVTAPRMFGHIHVAPLLVEFLRRHPAITVRAFFADHIVHLLDDGFDVALRIARLPDSGLTAVRVGHVRRVVVASPAYLAAHGVPRTPDDLEHHTTVGYAVGGTPTPAWEFAGGTKRAHRLVTPRASFLTNSNETAIVAALAGHGLARALSYQVADHVAAGRLRLVLTAFETAPIPVQLVHAGGRQPSAKVAAFVAFATERLRRAPVLRGELGTRVRRSANATRARRA